MSVQDTTNNVAAYFEAICQRYQVLHGNPAQIRRGRLTYLARQALEGQITGSYLCSLQPVMVRHLRSSVWRNMARDDRLQRLNTAACSGRDLGTEIVTAPLASACCLNSKSLAKWRGRAETEAASVRSKVLRVTA